MKFEFDVELKDGKYIINGHEYNTNISTASGAFRGVMFQHIGDRFWNLNGLYNKAVYWPEELQFAIQWTMNERYIIHATNHMFNKIQRLHLPRGCYKAMLYGEVIEAEVEHGKVVKVVTRLPHRFDECLDLCAAIVFSKDGYGTNIARVKTIWVNNWMDNHSTICKENYVQK